MKKLLLIPVLALVAAGCNTTPATTPPPAPAPETSNVLNQKSQFSNWKTYTNIKYGIELKYPETWEVSETIMNAEPATRIINKEYNPPDVGSRAHGAYEFIIKYSNYCDQCKFEKNIMIGAGPARELIFEPDGMGFTEYYLEVKNGNTILINLPISKEFSELDSTESGILSTFKFVK